MKKKYLVLIAALYTMSIMLPGCSNQNRVAENTASNETETVESATVPAAASAESTQSAASSSRNQESLLSAAETAPANPSSAPFPGQSGKQPDNLITESKALEIAYNHAGVKEKDVQFSRVKLEMDHGVQEYDVNFFTQGKEYDYDIDANTGDIRSFDYEVEDHAWTGQTDAGSGASITVEEATKKALERVPGASASDIRIKTDMDDGRTVYEGKIIYDNVEYEFEIDASTGIFLEWDSESVFD